MSTGASSQCPQCGAPLRFGGASSLCAVCSYCRAAVARDGVDLALVGTVPDLVATDRRLGIGMSGKLGGTNFSIIGHLQLARSDGSAAWDEWYVVYASGGWGWLAEAQGHLYRTKKMDGIDGLPRFESLQPGLAIDLTAIGRVVVEELSEAMFVAAEGELPFSPAIDGVYRFADASTDGAGFVTLDYGARDEAEAELFAGHEISYEDAHLAGLPAPAAPTLQSAALACRSCGAPLSLKRSDTQILTCPSCHSLVDATAGGALLKKFHERRPPLIPLGSKGTLDGEAWEVLGWTSRYVTSDGTQYFWEEYLLHGKPGYRWLSESGGHFVFLAPVSAASVEIVGEGASCGGHSYKLFSVGQARYAAVQGEFYFRLDADAVVEATDFVAPPRMLSCEKDAHEVNWTQGHHVDGKALWSALSLPGAPPKEVGVGAAQPNELSARFTSSISVAAIAAFVAIGISVALSMGDASTLATVSVPVAPDGGVTLSEPFEITGGPQAVDVKASADVNQAWVGLDVALINDETGESDAVGMELSRYSGVDDGESWSEGNNRGEAMIGGVRAGRYVLRVEPELQLGSGSVGPTAEVRVVRNPFRVGPLVLVVFLLLAYPTFLGLRRSSFEKRRWAESDFG